MHDQFIIWILILGKKVQVYRFDGVLAEKCNMNANISFTICPNVPG
jgi:hypothetical protein